MRNFPAALQDHARTHPALPQLPDGPLPAPCAGLVDAAEYQRMVRDVLMILEGKVSEVVRELDRQDGAGGRATGV